MKKSKDSQDLTIVELQKNAKNFKAIFYGYLIASFIIIGIGSYFSYQVVHDVFYITDSIVLTVLLLFGAMNILNFFLLFWIWTTNESSYYKMLQLHNEQLIFMKRKLGE